MKLVLSFINTWVPLTLFNCCRHWVILFLRHLLIDYYHLEFSTLSYDFSSLVITMSPPVKVISLHLLYLPGKRAIIASRTVTLICIHCSEYYLPFSQTAKISLLFAGWPVSPYNDFSLEPFYVSTHYFYEDLLNDLGEFVSKIWIPRGFAAFL